MEKKKKTFVLLDSDNKATDPPHIFSARQPRGAALKAATRGHTDIRLRERGTNRVHVFKGWVETVDAPPNKPAWLPDKVKRAKVKKIGVERLS